MSLLSDYVSQQLNLTDSVTTTSSTIAGSSAAIKTVKDDVDTKVTSAQAHLVGTDTDTTVPTSSVIDSMALNSGVVSVFGSINLINNVADSIVPSSYTNPQQTSYSIGKTMVFQEDSNDNIAINTLAPTMYADTTSRVFGKTATAYPVAGTWRIRGKAAAGNTVGYSKYIVQRVA